MCRCSVNCQRYDIKSQICQHSINCKHDHWWHQITNVSVFSKLSTLWHQITRMSAFSKLSTLWHQITNMLVFCRAPDLHFTIRKYVLSQLCDHLFQQSVLRTDQDTIPSETVGDIIKAVPDLLLSHHNKKSLYLPSIPQHFFSRIQYDKSQSTDQLCLHVFTI